MSADTETKMKAYVQWVLNAQVIYYIVFYT